MALLNFWKKSHNLSKMTLRDLVVAYFQHYTILAYLALAAVSMWAAVSWTVNPLMTGASVLAAILFYPLLWYVLHRWVLHGAWLYRSPLTAAVWKRIHYDHHQDPHHLEVLFGALYTTLPTIVLATIPIGYALEGPGGAAAALAAGLVWTCFYEFCHCVQHLPYKPKNKFLADMKARHMAHHFQDEKGNFGITNFFWDRLFGTFYEREERPVKSLTVFNLGYTDAEAARYPWVARLSGGVWLGTPRGRRQTKTETVQADTRNAA